MYIKLSTFNLFNFIEPPNAFYELDNIYSLKQWGQKQQWTMRLLRSIDADIVGFQEVFSTEPLEALVAEAGFEHFVTVDEPRASVGHVYDHSVVALASRFPILSASCVEPDPLAIAGLQLQSTFQFSRQPLKAEVLIDGFAKCLVYVVHLKSKRPQVEHPVFSPSPTLKEKVEKTLLAHLHGNWSSTVQRGTEAALLYYDITKEMIAEDRPVIVLGDLNDNLTSAALKHITQGHEFRDVGGTRFNHLPKDAQRYLESHKLVDAYELLEAPDLSVNYSTHYYGSHGDRLDYVLLSRDFNPDYYHSLAEVVDYQVMNRHLISPDNDVDLQCSDHAPVVVSVEARH